MKLLQKRRRTNQPHRFDMVLGSQSLFTTASALWLLLQRTGQVMGGEQAWTAGPWSLTRRAWSCPCHPATINVPVPMEEDTQHSKSSVKEHQQLYILVSDTVSPMMAKGNGKDDVSIHAGRWSSILSQCKAA